MEPFTIRRAGQDYNDGSIPSASGGFASATALRRIIRESAGKDIPEPTASAAFHDQIPPAALRALAADQAHTAPVFPDDLSMLLQYRLLELMRQNTDLCSYADMSPELAARLERMVLDFDTFSGRIAQLKTRQYTYTRISRALLHLILGITAKQADAPYAPYARILGFKKSSSILLSDIKKSASIPIITKTADAAGFLSPAAYDMLKEDMYASHLYQTMVFQKGRKMKNEYTKSVIILP